MLGPRGTPNQEEHIRHESRLAGYDRSAATLPNHKRGGRRYGAARPSYIPTIALSHEIGNEVRSVRPDQRLKSPSHGDGCHTGGSGVKSTPYVNDDGHYDGLRLRGTLQGEGGQG